MESYEGVFNALLEEYVRLLTDTLKDMERRGVEIGNSMRALTAIEAVWRERWEEAE